MTKELRLLNSQIRGLVDLTSSINRSTFCNYVNENCKLQLLCLTTRPTLEGFLSELRAKRQKLLLEINKSETVPQCKRSHENE